MKISKKIIYFLLISFALLISCSSATTLIVQSVQVDTAGESTAVNVILDSAPTGLSGYNITVSVTDPSVAKLASVTFAGWATLHDNGTLPASSCWIKAVDTAQMITPGSTNVTFATFTIQGIQTGSTSITLGITAIDDFSGDVITPSVQPGVFRVAEQPSHADINNTQQTPVQTSNDNSHINGGVTGVTSSGGAPGVGSGTIDDSSRVPTSIPATVVTSNIPTGTIVSITSTSVIPPVTTVKETSPANASMIPGSIQPELTGISWLWWIIGIILISITVLILYLAVIKKI